MTAPTLNGSSLGTVESINWVKDANIIPIPYPGQDSNATETFDLLGVTKIMTITGYFSGTSTAVVKALVDAIAALVAGNQSASVNFISDETGTIQIKVASFDVTWNPPSNKANYTLKLYQGV